MLTRRQLVRGVGSILLMTMTVALNSCGLISEPSPPQLISMTVRDGEVAFAWCGPSAELSEIQIFHGSDTPDSAKLVEEETGRLRVEPGDVVGLGEPLEGWEVDITPPPPGVGARIGITVYFDENDGPRHGYYSSERDVGDNGNIENWPEGVWQWPSGETSKERCGMSGSRYSA